MPPGDGAPRPGSLGRVDARAFLDELTADTDIASHWSTCASCRRARRRSEPFPDGLPELLVSRLGPDSASAGSTRISRDGLAVLRDGRDLVIATGTASGKTLVYNAAFAEAALTRRRPPRSTSTPRRRSRAISSGPSAR